MPIDTKEAERVVLSQANEDYCGLYEIVWELNGLYPASTLDEKYAAAGQAVRSLIGCGWISLYRFYGPVRCNRFEDVGALSTEEVLANPVSWYPEYGGIRIVFAATEEGEQGYAAGALAGG